jgi:hypothetical protein
MKLGKEEVGKYHCSGRSYSPPPKDRGRGRLRARRRARPGGELSRAGYGRASHQPTSAPSLEVMVDTNARQVGSC